MRYLNLVEVGDIRYLGIDQLRKDRESSDSGDIL